MESARRRLRHNVPWAFASLALAALIVQLIEPWQSALIYDRSLVESAQLWRLWTGHLVHFGWPHTLVDAGLLLILGGVMRDQYPVFKLLALVLMPVLISLSLYFFDPTLHRYGGLSAINLALLVYVALQGWQRRWTDWFWPAILAIYIGEIVFETIAGGRGGGMIPFDEPDVKIATSAHVAGAAYALIAWIVAGFFARARCEPSAPPDC